MPISSINSLNYILNTDGLEEAARHAAYRDRLDAILDTTFLTDSFRARMTAYQVGTLSVIMLDASARRSVRTAERIAADRYDMIGVQLAIEGSARGHAKGRPVASLPGTIMLLDYAQPFDIVDDETRVVVNVAVPRAHFPLSEGGPANVHGTVLTGDDAAMLASFMRTLPKTLEAQPQASGDVLARIFLDLLALAQNAAPLEDRSGIPAKQRGLIARAERIVDLRIGSQDLTPAWLAAKLNVSRSTLYTLMEEFGGASRFILGRRLAAARAALLAKNDTRRIGDIAYACGFASEPQFARAFRMKYGCTASELRRNETNSPSAADSGNRTTLR